jgi:hypothetical protein
MQRILDGIVKWISKQSRRKLSFKQLKDADEIRVTSTYKHFSAISEQQRIYEVIDFLKNGFWYSPFTTPPGGDLRMAFYTQGKLLDVIFISPNVLMTHGNEFWWRHIEKDEYRKLSQMIGLEEQGRV